MHGSQAHPLDAQDRRDGARGIAPGGAYSSTDPPAEVRPITGERTTLPVIGRATAPNGGQIAIHGREGLGGTLGTAVSHGCVRLDTASIDWLAARIGPGTPVTIVAPRL